MYTIPERTGSQVEILRKLSDKLNFDLRVCCPGIVKSFNPDKLTCTVQLSLREQLVFDGDKEWVDIPLLTDVPVVITGTADYFITFPIVEGTECLVVFNDACIDGWWQSGGIQNQLDRRRHDLSDGMAIIGPRSQVNLIDAYSMNGVQIRDKAGTALVSIEGKTINIATTGTVNIGNGDVVINSRIFLEHQHSGVTSGGSNTGGVV